MPKPLRIGYVLDDTLDTPDGVQQYVLTIGEWMRSQGNVVHYLVGQTVRQDIQNVHSLARNVKVSFNQNRLSVPLPANKKRLQAIMDELALDVIHVQMPYSPLFAGRLIQCTPPQTRIVGTFHIVPATWLERSGARTLQMMSRSTLKKFDTIVSVGTAAQRFCQTVFGMESLVIPNAVALRNYRRKPIIDQKSVHIVFLGRLVERKGCIWLLKALKILQELPPRTPYHVTIAGKGALLQQLEKYVADSALTKIRFIGFVDEVDKPNLLASADIAVFPSTGGESFGIVLIEAMAAGSRVVIGGNNVGYSSVLGEKPELLFDPRQSADFAEKLRQYIDDPAARTVTALWNKTTVERYDVAVVGKELQCLYKK